MTKKISIPKVLEEAFACSPKENWVRLELKDGYKPEGFTDNRIGKLLPDGRVAFTIGSGKAGRDANLDKDIRAVFYAAGIVPTNLPSSRDKTVLYPSFNLSASDEVTTRYIFAEVIAAVRNADSMRLSELPSTYIEIDWDAGVERFAIDLDKPIEEIEVRHTEQHVNETGEDWPYETTSVVSMLSDGRFEIKINYAPERNKHIEIGESWWGTTTIILKKGKKTGKVQWDDTFHKENNGSWKFRIVSNLGKSEVGDHMPYSDDQEIEARTDLKATQKEVLINARRGQGLFRAKVLLLEKFCRVTGTDDPSHLRASHIKPWATSDDSERLDGCNGLMLAPHVDHLFDKAYISFEDSGELLVLNNQIEQLLTTWHIHPKNLAVAPRPFSRRQCEFLRTHRLKFYKQQANGLQGA